MPCRLGLTNGDVFFNARHKRREVFGLVPLWQSIEALDNKVPDLAQSEILIEIGRLIARATSGSCDRAA